MRGATPLSVPTALVPAMLTLAGAAMVDDGLALARPLPKEQIVFVSDRDGDDELFEMDADGTRVRQLTRNRVSDSAPSVSRNGRIVVFIRSEKPDQTTGDVWIIDRRSGRERRLAAGAYTSPAWEPTGVRVIAARRRSRNDCNRQLHRIRVVDGRTAPIPLLEDSSQADPAPSADGRRIAYTAWGIDECEHGSFPSIGVMAITGRRARELDLQIGSWDIMWADPTWSWSTDHLAYSGEVSVPGREGSLGNWAVYVARPDGTQICRVTPTKLHAMSSAFARAGAWLAFTGRRGAGSEDIWIVRSDGSGLRRLTTLPSGDHSPAWAAAATQ